MAGVVTVLYFAAVRDLVGIDEEQIALPDSVGTIGAFADLLQIARPPLAGRLGSVRFARNETFATNSEPIAPGDVIALIPPVAGG
jgi:molybdopterin converting factor subunit 1